MFGTYGKETFTLKDYIKAFGIMHMDAPDFMHKITKIELLNEHFHMANMSITELPEQTTSNKTGINALFSRFAHWSITSADYWNRMTMFTAQMIHDGCFDAYEVDRSGGYSRLVYNMEKDERFKILCEYANKPNAIPHNLRKKFAYQKSLYKKMREDMISDSGGDIQIAELKDGVNTGKDWYLPKAYTNKQRNSLKSFADITFGYYDKETKAWFFKTALGGVFKQFMAYMTAKKSQYFFVRTDKTDRGSYEQVTDSKGNKIFKILITNDNGEIRPIEITENELHNNYKDQIETAEPVLCWTGAYMEGVFNSIVHLCTSLTKGSISAIKDGDTELLKEIYNQYIKKGDIRHSNLLQAL